ncbi:hypothetical protein COCHEDRAFT_1021419 [Bipolaris maydis C5]|uniref:Secreted protein n=1 Tax=Cochliobolus heterostrophus (strain C5 / ATCC 48332 / race O) TaxID=701091 RepID=M2T1D5_COCH5|nr:hypothetical protein COCHEDRAFT_1021419 [Bipolaris maydis C5]
MSLLLEPSLVSFGSAALVAATAAAEDDDWVKGGAEVNAGGESSSGDSRDLLRSSASSDGK